MSVENDAPLYLYHVAILNTHQVCHIVSTLLSHLTHSRGNVCGYATSLSGIKTGVGWMVDILYVTVSEWLSCSRAGRGGHLQLLSTW